MIQNKNKNITKITSGVLVLLASSGLVFNSQANEEHIIGEGADITIDNRETKSISVEDIDSVLNNSVNINRVINEEKEADSKNNQLMSNYKLKLIEVKDIALPDVGFNEEFKDKARSLVNKYESSINENSNESEIRVAIDELQLIISEKSNNFINIEDTEETVVDEEENKENGTIVNKKDNTNTETNDNSSYDPSTQDKNTESITESIEVEKSVGSEKNVDKKDDYKNDQEMVNKIESPKNTENKQFINSEENNDDQKIDSKKDSSNIEANEEQKDKNDVYKNETKDLDSSNNKADKEKENLINKNKLAGELNKIKILLKDGYWTSKSIQNSEKIIKEIEKALTKENLTSKEYDQFKDKLNNIQINVLKKANESNDKNVAKENIVDAKKINKKFIKQIDNNSSDKNKVKKESPNVKTGVGSLSSVLLTFTTAGGALFAINRKR